jgi:uncharacterized protein YqeY
MEMKMTILDRLNSYTLELRKSRDPLAATFQQIQAGANAAAKSRSLDAPVSDEDAVAALKKAAKNAKDMLAALDGRIGEANFRPGHSLYEPRHKAQTELDAIQSLLPRVADVTEVRAAAETFVATTDGSMKAMGATMAHLREKFGDSLDSAQASAIVRTLVR